jgi:hypothetical protein
MDGWLADQEWVCRIPASITGLCFIFFLFFLVQLMGSRFYSPKRTSYHQNPLFVRELLFSRPQGDHCRATPHFPQPLSLVIADPCFLSAPPT